MALNDPALPEDTRLPLHLLRPRLRRVDASAYLLHEHGFQVAAATLAKYASVGGGPAFQKAGRQVYYAREDLDAWARERLGAKQRSTSDIARN
ncbi:MAG: hypothetical protein U0795_00030 [Pirellulales bacterium]